MTVRQWLTRVERKLTSRTTNSIQTKKKTPKDTSDYSKPHEKAGKQTQQNTFRALVYCDMGVALIAYRRM